MTPCQALVKHKQELAKHCQSTYLLAQSKSRITEMMQILHSGKNMVYLHLEKLWMLSFIRDQKFKVNVFLKCLQQIQIALINLCVQ